jgi:hypothetical protein
LDDGLDAVIPAKAGIQKQSDVKKTATSSDERFLLTCDLLFSKPRS